MIIFDIEYEGQFVSIAAIYAPNQDNPGFFEKVKGKLRDRHVHRILIGDFNLTLNVDLDRLNTYNNNTKARDVVERIMEEYEMRDVWRARNADVRQYSWIKSGCVNKASRIDLALVTAGLDQKVEMVQYLSSIKTDHMGLYMSVVLEEFERGVGFWKMNTALLQDKCYLEQLNKKLVEFISLNTNVNPKERWEKLKIEVKNFSKNFSKCKSRQDKLIISQLSEKVNEYESNLPLDEKDYKLLARYQDRIGK